jgi:hypothetical protein
VTAWRIVQTLLLLLLVFAFVLVSLMVPPARQIHGGRRGQLRADPVPDQQPRMSPGRLVSHHSSELLAAPTERISPHGIRRHRRLVHRQNRRLPR